MADFTHGGEGAGLESGRESPPPTPRWVKVFAVVVLALALLVVIVMATGIGGQHGPARHLPALRP